MFDVDENVWIYLKNAALNYRYMRDTKNDSFYVRYKFL